MWKKSGANGFEICTAQSFILLYQINAFILILHISLIQPLLCGMSCSKEWPTQSTVSFYSIEIPKKCLEDLTTFSCLLDEGIPKIWKKLNCFLSYLQNSTANSAHLAAHFCPVLVCPQKATVRIQFLPYFWNPLIK